jgi:hypothetical protein
VHLSAPFGESWFAVTVRRTGLEGHPICTARRWKTIVTIFRILQHYSRADIEAKSLLKLYRNLNYVRVRSFIPTGAPFCDVRYWPKADIDYRTAHVRYGPKADIALLIQSLHLKGEKPAECANDSATTKSGGLKSETLYRIIAVLLVVIAGVLLLAHDAATTAPPLTGLVQIAAGIFAGFIIGAIASLLGVAGGEFLIPTLVPLFGADIKLAGSLSLAVSLPTMLVGFTRYSRDQSFGVLRQNWGFLLVMAAGSIVGTFIGGRLLGLVPTNILLPLLAAVLVISAVKVWRHQ